MSLSMRRSLRSFLLAGSILASPLIAMAPIPAFAQAGIAITTQIAPPILPDYDQPPLPEDGYIWTPGYWAYSQASGYYWVPGTWVLPPQAGLLWTPPYWAWLNGAYGFHEGYWGSHVGYYGGVNYGYGYGGNGYEGGRWQGGHLQYNRTVNNFGSVHVAHGYQHNVTASRSDVSFAGGPHGLRTQPTAHEHLAEHDTHAPVTADQTRHVSAAAAEPSLAAAHNNGRPEIPATSRPAQLERPAQAMHARPAAAPHRAPQAAARPAQRPAAHPAAAHQPAAEERKK